MKAQLKEEAISLTKDILDLPSDEYKPNQRAIMIVERLLALLSPKGEKPPVLRDEEMLNLCNEYPTLDFSFEDDYREEVKALLEAQLEKCLPYIQKAQRKSRIEIMDWAYEECPHSKLGGQKRFCSQCWQALKDKYLRRR